jgi:hypothetical protein
MSSPRGMDPSSVIRQKETSIYSPGERFVFFAFPSRSEISFCSMPGNSYRELCLSGTP